MKGLIYKIICIPTGLAYIGKTRSTAQQRLYQHFSEAKQGDDRPIQHAIREHGRESFEIEVLQEWDNVSNEELNAAEVHYIQEHNTFHDGYNARVKGESDMPPVPIEKQKRMQEGLETELKRLMSVSLSPNTQRAYRHALAGFDGFLEGRTFSDEELAKYITRLHDEGKSPSTITIVVAAVRWQAKKGEASFHLPITDTVLAGIRRDGKERGRGQVDGLLWKDVEKVCIACELENTKAGYRDSALIRLMSDCLLRVSEVVAVNCGHLRGKTLHIPMSKTDTEGKGQSLYITDDTREIIAKYRDSSQLKRGALFRYIRRGDHVQTSRLHPHSARRIIQKRAKAVGIDDFISGHSLRVGSAVSLAQAGATVVDMQTAGRWKSSQMPAHYAKAEIAERGAIARFKDKKQ